MNLMISDEYCEGVLKMSAVSAERELFIQTIERDCTAFNGAKRDLFDSLNATIEALRDDSKYDLKSESDAVLRSILTAKDRLDTLFGTVLVLWDGGLKDV